MVHIQYNYAHLSNQYLPCRKIFHLVDPELKQIDWFCPVELISAKENKNIESIWKHAETFK
jgi:hypothetical protein